MHELIERAVTVEEFIELRNAVGWHLPGEEAIRIGLKNSLYSVCAVREGNIIAMARVVGDGSITFYIQDVIVMPDYQRRGIGAQIMESVMRYIAKTAAPGAIVGLMSAMGKEEFYEKFGFWRRPNENFGCGMMQFWQRGE